MSTSDDVTRPLARTVLAWRRTALSLVGLCLAAIKVIEWSTGLTGTTLAFSSLIAAGVVLAYAELGVRRHIGGGHRPVFELLAANGSVIVILSLAGVALAVTA